MANAPSPNDLTRQQLDELDALLQRMLALPAAKPADPPAPPTPLPMPEPAPAPAAEVPPAPPDEWRTDRPSGPPRSPHLAEAPTAPPEPADVFEAVARAPQAEPVGFAPTPAEPVRPTPGPVAPEPAVSFSYGPPLSFAPTLPPTPAVPFSPPEHIAPGRLFGPPTPDTGVRPPDAAPASFDPVPLNSSREASSPIIPDFGPLDLPDVQPPAAVLADAPPAPADVDAAPGVPFLLWPLFAVNWVLEQVLGLFGPPGQALTSPGMKHLLGGVGVLLLIAAGAWTANGMGWIQLPIAVP
jgi:hypothetical protein